MNFETISEKVTDWAKARQIIPNSNPMAQAMKGMEEASEWLQAASILYALKQIEELPLCDEASESLKTKQEYWKNKFKDGIGDTLVCIVNSAALANVNVIECFNIAYNEIKDRTGKMNEKGIFVKEK